MKHVLLFESFINDKLYHGNRKGDFPPKLKDLEAAYF